MPEVYLGSSPHIGTAARTSAIMAHVIIALIPSAVFGVVLYGLPALAVMAVSVISAAAAEAIFRALTKQENRSGDLSAVLTGLLLALIVPPSTPLWMIALGAVFAVVVAKEFFGGLGANVFNPALSGRAFLIMSFPAALTSWTLPRFAAVDTVSSASLIDVLSSATPLSLFKLGGTVEAVGSAFTAARLSASPAYWDTVKTLFIGSRSGSIGESSILCILAGAVYLLAFRVIDWRAPLAMTASAFALSFLLGVDPLFSILSGGLIFGAVFMATDYTSAPLTARGRLIFGAGAGIITVLIRRWGSYPEGVTYGILIMNAVTPFLNRLVQKKYGYVKAGAAR